MPVVLLLVMISQFRDVSSQTIQLKGGSTANEGNVYALNSENKLGPVCDDSWGDTDARVVCRQLGYDDGVATSTSQFGNVESEFSMDDVNCKGNENQLQDCQYNTHDNCGGSEGAGVICRNSVDGYEVGDMILSDEQVARLQNGLLEGELDGWTAEDNMMNYGQANAQTDQNTKWPNNQVYYSFASPPAPHRAVPTPEERKKVNDVLKALQTKLDSCITFTEIPNTRRSKYKQIIVTTRGPKCRSEVGYSRKLNGQMLFLSRRAKCLDQDGIIEHEFLHALGIYHHQSRSDRDKHVEILGDNIEGGLEGKIYKTNFNKYDERTVSHHGLPYDYDSVMHYGKSDFGIKDVPYGKYGLKRRTTIKTLNPTKQDVIGQRGGVSPGDIELVKRAYNCPTTTTTQSPTTTTTQPTTTITSRLPRTTTPQPKIITTTTNAKDMNKKLPLDLTIKVNVAYDQALRNHLGGKDAAEKYTLSVIEEAKKLFLLTSLGTRIHFVVVGTPRFLEKKSFAINHISRSNQNVRLTIRDAFALPTPKPVVIFTYTDDSDQYTGVAPQRKICDERNGILLLKWRSNLKKAAKSFAHVFGHTLGMLHDQDEDRSNKLHKDFEYLNSVTSLEMCKDSGLMTDNAMAPSKWSTCSKQRFMKEYSRGRIDYSCLLIGSL